MSASSQASNRARWSDTGEQRIAATPDRVDEGSHSSSMVDAVPFLISPSPPLDSLSFVGLELVNYTRFWHSQNGHPNLDGKLQRVLLRTLSWPIDLAPSSSVSIRNRPQSHYDNSFSNPQTRSFSSRCHSRRIALWIKLRSRSVGNTLALVVVGLFLHFVALRSSLSGGETYRSALNPTPPSNTPYINLRLL